VEGWAAEAAWTQGLKENSFARNRESKQTATFIKPNKMGRGGSVIHIDWPIFVELYEHYARCIFVFFLYSVVNSTSLTVM
jgi:hypothetical protein